jgi:hypothetical protein
MCTLPHPAKQLACFLGLSLALSTFASAQDSATIDLTGLKLQNGVNQSKTSAPSTISPATQYRFDIDANIKGNNGILAVLYPNPIPLAELLESLNPGSSSTLKGLACNPSGAHPVTLLDQPFSGEGNLGGIAVKVSLNFKAGINASNQAFFELTNVVINPAILVGSATITSGTAKVDRVACLADTDGNGTLNIDDFIAFQTLYALGDEAADVNCDGTLNINDFIEFQTLFALGC